MRRNCRPVPALRVEPLIRKRSDTRDVVESLSLVPREARLPGDERSEKDQGAVMCTRWVGG